MAKTNTVVVDVEKIVERNGRYSFVSDKVWYGLNKVRPEFKEGDSVQFEFSTNKGADGRTYNNVDADTVIVVTEGEEKPTKKVATASDVMSKDDYWGRKEAGDIYTQREIRWQGARNGALTFLNILLAHDAIPLGTKKAADKEELLLEYLNTYTSMFYTEAFAIREKHDEQFLSESLKEVIEDDLDSLK